VKSITLRLNALHSNDGCCDINISLKRRVTSAAARQGIPGKTSMPRLPDRALEAAMPSKHRRRPHHRQATSPPKSPPLFRQRLVYLFPRIEGRPIGRGGRGFVFGRFGKQLTAPLAKILAFQVIILAFWRDNTYVLAHRVTAERIGLAANSVPD
jgi:hypothetical protein